MKRGIFPRLAAAMLLLAAFWQLSQAIWIPAKAVVAQYLLEQAWRQSQQHDGHIRPWPWADTWPVARLIAPEHGVDQIVLAGDSGAVLAFAPGMSFAGDKPDEAGTVMISGHRDTHFRFLRDLEAGDRIRLQTRVAEFDYIVRGAQVVDSRDYRATDTADNLLLVTCYPFDTVQPGGTIRYLVQADRVF